MATDPLSGIHTRLTQIEAILEGMVPLLEQMVGRMGPPTQGLPTQTPGPAHPMATYADLYPQTEAGPPEGDLVAGRAGRRTLAAGWWGRIFQEKRG